MSVSRTRLRPSADATADMSPYGKRADLIVHEQDPFNAETSLAALAESPLTATDAFYVRGHGEVPEIDSAAWRLQVHGLVERELGLSLVTLREAFRESEVTATLQCAGNRRAGLMAAQISMPSGPPRLFKSTRRPSSSGPTERKPRRSCRKYA